MVVDPYMAMHKPELKQRAAQGDALALAELQRRKEKRLLKGKKAKGFDIETGP